MVNVKRKWWMIGAGVLCAALLSLCLFGVRVHIFPRWVLSHALGSALSQLENRFEYSPLHLISDALDPQGRQQAQLQMETEHEHLGVVYYDMSIHTQLAPNRVLAGGTVVAGGTALDLELYLDQDFAALSSQGLVDGTWYGITYDTFSQDIRSWSLLMMLAGEQTISGWEDSVAKLQDALSTDMTLPEFSAEDAKTALYGALTLKPQVDSLEMVLSGESRRVYTVSFRATGQEIAEAAASYQESLTTELLALIENLKNDENSAIEMAFFLHKDKLIRVEVSLVQRGNPTNLIMELGQFPASDPLTFELESASGNDLDRIRVTVNTVSDEEAYKETLHLSRTQNGVQQKLTLDYSWDLSSGEVDLAIQLNAKKAALRLNLAGEGERVIITTQDITPLMNLFLEKPMDSPAICTLKIRPGDSLDVPEYRNLSQWSVEDLLTLLAGFGGLLGIHVA